jgi:phospho-N-acetylmuramoyl-pentapeptide-transferase
VFRALVIGAIAFVIAMVAGGPTVAYLRRQKLGKAISVDAPGSHAVKAGTPTMGGVIIFVTVLLVTAPFNLQERLSILLPFCVIAVTGAMGVVDDLGSLQGRMNTGLTWRLKLSVLLFVGLVSGVVLWHPDLLDIHVVRVPYRGVHDIGLWVIPLSVAITVLLTPAVAITDGIDMLEGLTSATAFAAYGIIAAFQGQPFLGAFCFTVVGAVLGFLWFNAFPAKVFMGDTGALPLGSALSVVALMTGQWLVLPLIGAVFIANAAADVLQIAYFKWSGGKRLFKKAPLHHHFELLGWHETTVVMRFWLVSVIGAMLGVGLAIKV